MCCALNGIGGLLVAALSGLGGGVGNVPGHNISKRLKVRGFAGWAYLTASIVSVNEVD